MPVPCTQTERDISTPRNDAIHQTIASSDTDCDDCVQYDHNFSK